MNKTIAGTLLGIAIGSGAVFSFQVDAQEYEKASATELKINTSLSTTISLSSLKKELGETEEAKAIEIERSAARIEAFDARIDALNLKINEAEKLGIKEMQ